LNETASNHADGAAGYDIKYEIYHSRGEIMPRRNCTKDSGPPAISGAPLIDSDLLGWRDLRLTEWQGVAPQEAYEKELSRHLIVVHATPHSVRVYERAEGFRAEALARLGDVNVLSAGEEAFCRWDQPLSFVRLEIPPAFLKTVAARIEHPQSGRLQVIHAFHARDGKMLQIIRWLADELRHGGLGGKLYSDSLTDLLALHLLRHYTGPPAGRAPIGPSALTRKEITRAIEYFNANLDQMISLNDVADAARMSPSHFPRLFRRSTGLSPHQFLIRLRVTRAKELLLAGSQGIAEIAAEVGFADQSHLTRHFKRLVGTTPKKFRSR